MDHNLEIKNCPKCGTDLKVDSVSKPSFAEQVPHKSPGTAALIAFIGGIFGIMGIGHIYVGKVGLGIGILISGIVLIVLVGVVVVAVYSIVPFADSNEVPTAELNSYGIWILIIAVVFGIGYFVLFIWQIFSARKYAKKFNELARTSHREPW